MGFPFDPVGAGLVYNVKSYGAFGDGVQDDTAAIENANSALVANGGELWYPTGTYNLTGQSPATSGKRVKIVGAGQSAKLVNTGASSGTSTCTFYIDNSNIVGGDWLEIADLFLEGNSTGGMGIYLVGVNQGRLTNIRADGFTAGAGWGAAINLFQYVFSCLITNPVITGCSYAGIIIQDVSNANQIIGGWIYENLNGSFGIRILSGDGNTIIGTIIQGSGAGGQGGVELNGEGNTLLSCWIENNDIGVYANEPDSVIQDCIFTVNTTAAIAVESGSSNLLIKNCHFLNAQTITLASGSTGTVFDGCTGMSNLTITDSSGGKFAIRNCPGYNPVGSAVPGTAFALPASGTAWTNNTGVDGTLFVTAAGTVTDVVVQGVTVGSSLAVGQSYFVPVGGTFTLTYSASPTLVFVGN